MEKITEIVKLSLQRKELLKERLFCDFDSFEENLMNLSSQIQLLANELNILAITDYRNFSKPSIAIQFSELEDLQNIVEDYEVITDGNWEHYDKTVELDEWTIELTCVKRFEEHKKTQAI